MAEGRVLLERDAEVGIARLTLDNPARRNAYDPAMRDQLCTHLDDLADDDIKVVHLRGSEGVFSTGADFDFPVVDAQPPLRDRRRVHPPPHREAPEPVPFPEVIDGGRVIQDTFASAVCHGMLTRFPQVKLLSVENGGSWVGPLLHSFARAYKKMPQEFPEHPRETFTRNVWVTPFWEDFTMGLIDLVGVDRVCFGSDYPHPEGLADPLSWRDELGDLCGESTRKIMSDNMHDLMGISPAAA